MTATTATTKPIQNEPAMAWARASWMALTIPGMNGFAVAGSTLASLSPTLPTPVRLLLVLAESLPTSEGGILALARSFGSSLARVVDREVPATARPMVPPIWRMNVSVLVATPSLEIGTEFWTTKV